MATNTKRGDWKNDGLSTFFTKLKDNGISENIIKYLEEKIKPKDEGGRKSEPTIKDILPFLKAGSLLEQHEQHEQEEQGEQKEKIHYCEVKQLTEYIEELKSYEETKIRKVFSDPIHGQFEVHPACEIIIDTPQFQRLRFLKKIGTCHFVFPGASHSRFEHALGVCHLAGKFVRALRQKQPYLDITYNDMLCVEIGGLCCSLGYGPFSRLYEEGFLPELKKMYSLEERTIAMFELLLEQTCTSNSNKTEKTSKERKKIKRELMETYSLDDKDIEFIKEIISGPKITGSTAWPYVGRKPHKAFLYEIVYNKRNNIDAYRFDYLARDCYHLGLKNNFDHLRYIQMARVIDVDGELQICMRDKEVGNLHNFFYTRYTLMRTAYNHKVNCAIELMICEAMLKAQEDIFFLKKDGETMVKLSECHSDMEAYLNLTDNVIFQICHFQGDNNAGGKGNMKKAKDLIERVIRTRELYTCVFESEPFNPKKLKKMMTGEHTNDSQKTFIAKKIWENVSNLNKEIIKNIVYGGKKTEGQTVGQIKIEKVFKVQVTDLDFGMKGENPIERLKVYSKRNINEGKHPTLTSRIFSPQYFQEESFRVFSKVRDKDVCTVLNVASKTFASDLAKKTVH